MIFLSTPRWLSGTVLAVFAATALYLWYAVGLDSRRRMQGASQQEAASSPEVVALHHDVDSLMNAAIADHAFPGASVAIGRRDGVLLLGGYGSLTYAGRQQVTPLTQYDLASLTKVVATTTAVMKLYEQGRIDLDAPVVRYLPAFGQNGKEGVTLRHLLTHTSGLRPFRPFYTEGITSRAEVLDEVLREPLLSAPGTQYRYSDLGMIVLMRVVETISGEDFATFTRRAVFAPLGMDDTGFRSVGRTDTTIAPTERDETFRHRLMQGEVHDETAWVMGGTSGHAGLFSNAVDLARFALMMLHEGRVGRRTYLQPATIRLFTARTDTASDARALGWDLKSLEGYTSAGTLFGPNSYGHTGFTGTSMWIDPDAGLFVILLTNRVYPTRDNHQIANVRPALADVAFRDLILHASE